MGDAAEELQRSIEKLERGLLLVVTGAGVSHGSGISTFRGRDAGAVWRQTDTRKATFEYFREDPVGQWTWYLERFDAVERAKPNAGHFALAALEKWQCRRGGRFVLVTQNIDTLHEAAGSRRLIKVHGTSDRVRCSSPGCSLGAPAGSLRRSEIDLKGFRAEPSRERLPRCPVCASPLRAHVLFFDEYYNEHLDYRFDEVRAAAAEAGVILFAGTSFSVGVTDLILQAGAARRAPIFSIDPERTPLPAWLPVRRIEALAEEVLPRVCRDLGAAPAAAT